ncbi:MAG: phosphomannomutase/phosphoglucomutase [Candidatus Aenigmarchaeota archaeon]|nr:phosphomannomutase/phosphoglucomutase [Candidatus Aenigmarchaeota archaeon]
MNPLIFRAYDIRGIYGKDFNDDDAGLIGSAYVTYTKPRTVIVGCDNRVSSPGIKNSLIDGLTSCGADVTDIGIVPTPVLYWSVIHFDADGGIMVTASHLGKEYNGFKLCGKNVVSLADKDILELRRIIEKREFAKGSGKVIRKNVIDEYVADIKKRINIRGKFKIAIDAGNGTAGITAKKLFNELDVTCIHCEPDGNFPSHCPDPTVEHALSDLKRAIKKEHCDLGIAYDGDGDRVVFLDENADAIYGDQALAIFSRQILRENPGSKILFEVKCSRGLAQDIEEHHGIPVMQRTGHSFIKNSMRKDEKIKLAGEMSGHFFFREFYGIDDALFASAKMISILENRKLSEIVKTLPKYCSTPEIRINVKDKFGVVEELKKKIERLNGVQKIIEIDGVRAEFEHGWGLVRASNTSPCLILRFEAETEKRLDEIKKMFAKLLDDYGIHI